MGIVLDQVRNEEVVIEWMGADIQKKKKKKKKDLQGWVGKIWCTNWDVENKISRRVGHNDADKTTFVHEKKYLEIKILFSRCLDFFGQWCKVCQSKDPVPVSFSKERHKYPH